MLVPNHVCMVNAVDTTKQLGVVNLHLHLLPQPMPLACTSAGGLRCTSAAHIAAASAAQTEKASSFLFILTRQVAEAECAAAATERWKKADMMSKTAGMTRTPGLCGAYQVRASVHGVSSKPRGSV